MRDIFFQQKHKVTPVKAFPELPEIMFYFSLLRYGVRYLFLAYFSSILTTFIVYYKNKLKMYIHIYGKTGRQTDREAGRHARTLADSDR